MNNLEKSILLAAYKNHTHERRVAGHWRIGIRAYITQDPFELSAETKLIDGIHENNWLKFQDLNPVKNLVNNAKATLDQYLASHHFENAERGRTANITPEIFMKLGYVFVTSNKIFERSKADALLQDWQKRGLDCFIMAELSPGSDLYATEALGFTKHADLVKTVHLVPRGFSGRVPGSIESCLVGEKETVIKEAKKTVDTAFQGLEKEGLAVQVTGYNFCFQWNGITLTRSGVAMAERIKEDAYQSFLAEQAAKAEKQCKIKCLSCGEILLQTTSRFRSDRDITGDMIEFIPNLSQAGWSVKFGPSDTGDALMCPACGEGLIDPDSFRFRDGVLIEIESEEAGADRLNNFISERCVTDPDKESTAGDLYTTYESWAQDIGSSPISKKAFGLALAERGFSASRASGGVRIWTGIGLKRDA